MLGAWPRAATHSFPVPTGTLSDHPPDGQNSLSYSPPDVLQCICPPGQALSSREVLHPERKAALNYSRYAATRS